MLASITPLGERSRDNRWSVTALTFALGSLAGGLLIGSALGAVGKVLLAPLSLPRTAMLAVLSVLCLVGIAVDAPVRGLRLPTTRRQVDPGWITLYRNQIYGFGFGFQLGLGIVTIVTASATYLCLFAAFVSGSPAVGALIGGVFGAVRGAAILPAARVSSPERLMLMSEKLSRLQQAAKRAALCWQAAIAVGLAAAIALA